jgi:hypothetical protein
LTYKGVVFNEMKGVYSSPDSMFYRTVQRALFPDNTYAHDSGGDPVDIPSLTFEQFQVGRQAGAALAACMQGVGVRRDQAQVEGLAVHVLEDGIHAFT